MVKWGLKKSPWIYHLNTGGCNGCDIELLAAVTAKYDPERFGVKVAGTPKHADIIIVTGPVNWKNKSEIKDVMDQTPDPKKVLVLGSCGISEGVFTGSYNIAGPMDQLEEVDLYVPGCPVKPEAIIHGIKKLAEEMETE